MLEEHDHVVLTNDFADPGLNAGDVGAIVHVHRDGEAFDVEFQAPDGDTMALATRVIVAGASGDRHGHHGQRH